MSKLTEQLKKYDIFNPHNLVSKFHSKDIPGSDLIASYQKPEGGRSMRPTGTSVWAPDRKTDFDAHWFNHGAKFFYGKKAQSTAEALAWIKTNYPDLEMVASPYKDVLVSSQVMQAMKAFLKAQPKET